MLENEENSIEMKQSFSSSVKEELGKMNNLANKQLVKAEFMGYMISSNISYQKRNIKFVTENKYNINRFGKLLSNLNYSNYQIDMSGKNFVITFELREEELENQEGFLKIEKVQNHKKEILLQGEQPKDKMVEGKEEEKKAFVRGSFLGGGSMNNPKNNYHLEILFKNQQNATIVLEILKEYGILLKILPKKKNYAIYTKDGEEISKFLAFMGASQSVLKFEEIRVYRDMRNHVNRKVNCETANLNKTIDAAMKQIEAIKRLQKTNQFKNLSKPLQEIAILRLENPDASLTELGQMLEKPIGKSGVNHRLKTIENFKK